MTQKLREAPARSGAGQVAQAAGGDVKAGEKDGVVAKVYEITCRHGAGAGADISENNTNADQQTDLSPGAPELLGVSESKKRACGDNARGDTKLACDHGVDAAAKNCFFDDRSHEDAQSHEHQDALPAAEKLFHGDAGFASDKVAQPAHHDGQSEAAKNITQ